MLQLGRSGTFIKLFETTLLIYHQDDKPSLKKLESLQWTHCLTQYKTNILTDNQSTLLPEIPILRLWHYSNAAGFIGSRYPVENEGCVWLSYITGRPPCGSPIVSP